MKKVFLLLCLYLWSVRETIAVCENGEVRLLGLGVTGAGRVELCREREWGTVCSRVPQWSLKNAQVVCRSLGFTTAVTAIPQESLVARLQADSSVSIYLTDLECDGSESSIINCTHSTDTTQCSHFNDVAIVCAAIDTPENVTPGDVRLLGDTADFRGAVEYYDVILGWTGVCADSAHSGSWVSGSGAEVVCNQLGFEGGRPFVQSASFLDKLLVADLDCGSGFSLEDCGREGVVFSGGCTSQDAGWVECQPTERDDFSVRLLPGGREGIVEVSYNGRWGTVCEDLLWQQPNSEVVCDQLGLSSESAPSTTPQTFYGQYMSRLKPFWLSSVSCSGIDGSLEECDRSLLIGYSADCSLSSPTVSAFDSAEVNCGPPVPYRLGGGAIAGIVISVIAFITAVTLGFIYLPERWKRRHSYSWYRKLTTPSRWCEGVWSWCRSHAPSRPRVRSRNRPNVVTTAAVTMATTVSDTSSRVEQSPGGTEQRHTNSDESEVEQSPRGQSSEPTFTAAAPPPYQAAVNYPVATGPPAYSEKATLNQTEGLPYPTATYYDPAYPPPLPGQSTGNLPYPT